MKTIQWFLDNNKNVYVNEGRVTDNQENTTFLFSGEISPNKTDLQLFLKPLLPPNFKVGNLLRGSEIIGFITQTPLYGCRIVSRGLNVQSKKIEEASWLPISKALLFKYPEQISLIIKDIFFNKEEILEILKQLN